MNNQQNSRRKTSVVTMLGVGFGMLILFLCAVVLISLFYVNKIERELTQINDINAKQQRHAIDFRGSVHDRSIAIRDVVLLDNADKAGLEKLLAEIARLESFYKKAEDNMKKDFVNTKILNEEELAIFNKIQKTQAEAIPMIVQITQAKLDGNSQKAYQILKELTPYLTQWLTEINEFIDYEERWNDTITKDMRDQVQTFHIVLIICLVCGAIFGISLAIATINKLFHSLGGEPYIASSIVSRIAKGNLSQPVSYKNKDSMLYAIAIMQDELKKIVLSITRLSNRISEVSSSIDETSSQAQNAAHTQTQSSALVASKIEKINESVIEIAHIAQQTEENSAKTVEVSAKGVNTINITAQEIGKITEMIGASADNIRNLQEQSIEIGGSANLIAEIADQTNLLALNAAIEAARAGEHGRGFAVVADEVRKLAEKTSLTTTEIGNRIKLIQDNIGTSVDSIEAIVPQIQKGQDCIMDSIKVLEEIQQQAQDSLNKAKSVASSSSKQEGTMKSIHDDMRGISTLSKETNQSLENANTVISELKGIADMLKKHIAYFNL